MQVLALHVHCTDRVQKWVEAVFVDAGFEYRPLLGIGDDVSPVHIVATVAQRRAEALLLPFQYKARGNASGNGLDLALRLQSEVPWARRAPIYVLVGVFSFRVFLQLTQGETHSGIFYLHEDELMNGTISDRMREFAAAPHAVRSAAG